ncbi:hypothetical protein JVU11DRAFT_6959 [Chiua virens]|nr:hypothetical protein JVU11DRAFT_6959 [Chiua virens]
MAAALQRTQLRKLCSSSDTFEKALSIMRLVDAKTRPGSGFVVKNTIAIPAVCAYFASEQLNSGEVSLQSAMSAACINQTEFSDILKKVRAALNTDESNTVSNVTYEKLVDTYHVLPREDVIACMQDAEVGVPRGDMLKERYGGLTLTCAIFYWVCQLIEEPSVQERALCQTYSLPLKAFKAIVSTLDKQCDALAHQITSYIRQRRHSAHVSQPAQPGPNRVSESITASPQKSPVKSAMKSRITMTPSKKRTVAFSRLSSEGNEDADAFPETPTKKRRLDSASPTKPGTSSSPAKRSSAASTAAFHAVFKSSPTKLPAVEWSESPSAGPSTPRPLRHSKPAEDSVQVDLQSSPSRSQGQTSPTRPVVRRRFRPVFLEQQQWFARDPKAERLWAIAKTHRDQTMRRGGAVAGAA